MSQMKKVRIKYDDIKKLVADAGWQLVSTEYKNLDTEMEFICNEGHQVLAPWKKLRNKLECPICKKNQYYNIPKEVVAKPKGVQRVLALDQATKITGYSIFDGERLIRYGVFETDNSDTMIRYKMLRDWLICMINIWNPDIIAIEGIQFQENLGSVKVGVTTFEALARLQGILLMVCTDLKVQSEICHTAVWRQYCGVKGRTRTDKKNSMRLLAKEWFDVNVTEDEADAIGIGKYAANTFKKKNQVVYMDW